MKDQLGKLGEVVGLPETTRTARARISAFWFARSPVNRLLLAIAALAIVGMVLFGAVRGVVWGVDRFFYNREVQQIKKDITEANANAGKSETKADDAGRDREIKEARAVEKETRLNEQLKETSKAKERYDEIRKTPVNRNRTVTTDDERRVRADLCAAYPQLCDK